VFHKVWFKYRFSSQFNNIVLELHSESNLKLDLDFDFLHLNGHENLSSLKSVNNCDLKIEQNYCDYTLVIIMQSYIVPPSNDC